MCSLLTYVVQYKGGSIAVLPEDHSPHAAAGSVGGVVLSSDKTVLHYLVTCPRVYITTGIPYF